jgi:hypothetical protein
LKRVQATQSVAVYLLAVLLIASPALRASQAPKDSEEINRLLADAKTESVLLKADTGDLQTFTRSKLTWQSFAGKLEQIKNHVNELGNLTTKLNNSRDSGSRWQQDAMDHINPLLRDLASSDSATIKRLSENQSRVHTAHYQDYVQTTHEQASDLSGLIAYYVEYGKSKDKMEAQAKEL